MQFPQSPAWPWEMTNILVLQITQIEVHHLEASNECKMDLRIKSQKIAYENSTFS